MTRCTLFVSVPTLETLYNQIGEVLPDHTLSIDPQDGTIRALADHCQGLVIRLIDERLEGDRFTGILTGLRTVFAGIKTTHGRVKAGLMDQISQLTTVALIVPDTPENGFEDALLDQLGLLGYRTQGLFLTPGGDLYTGRGDLVLNLDGVSDLDDYAFSTPRGGQDQTVEAVETNEARKQRSHDILRAHGIPVCPDLPPLVADDKVQIRRQEEVTNRAVGLLIAALYGEFVRDSGVDSARVNILAPLFADDPGYDPDVPSPFGLAGTWDILTPSELAFMANDKVTPQDTARFVRRSEGCRVALWALGLVGPLPYPDTVCAPSSLVGVLMRAGSMAAFYQGAKLARAADLLDQADVMARYHQACDFAAQTGQPAPGGLDPDVVRERYRMLAWVICQPFLDGDEITF